MINEFSGRSLEDLIYLFFEAPDHEKSTNYGECTGGNLV